MNFGSLDFSTWRLVGLGLLALGAIAAVVAIVAIILMFRGGGTAVDRRAAETEWDDDEDDEDDDHDADDHDAEDPSPRDARRDRDGGPTAVPVGLGSPTESLFTVPEAPTSTRQPLRSTGDEAHVPSPDWYDYADVDATPAVDDHDDDARTALLGATREVEPPATPTTPTAPPPAPAPPSAAEQQPVLPDRDDSGRPSSRWFDVPAADQPASELPPSFLAQYSDTKPPPAAGAPVIFPWERRSEPTDAAPERRVSPPPQEPRRLNEERHAERSDTGTGTADAVPTATPHRPDVPPPAAPNPPARQEPQRPTTERHDTGTIAAVPTAASTTSDERPAKPTTAVREESNAPEADWYDDPDGSGGERWWDGKSWTRHRRLRSGAPMTTDTGRQRAVAKPQAAPPATTAGGRRPSAESDGADSAAGASSRPPGWYRDPSGAGGRRFWDGSRWTTET